MRFVPAVFLMKFPGGHAAMVSAAPIVLLLF
jgi:hypothetical protein